MSPAEAVRGLLDALAVPAEWSTSSMAALEALYRSRVCGSRVLVILDDARDAEQVRPLLPGSPECLVVVTSRRQLTGLVAAEGAYAVRPVDISVASPRGRAARSGGTRARGAPTA
jgi:hypothetical protein